MASKEALADLKAYRDQLLSAQTEASLMDDALFHRLFAEGVKRFKFDSVDVASLRTSFGISTPTYTRWLNGSTAPHPVLRPEVYRYLENKANDLLQWG